MSDGGSAAIVCGFSDLAAGVGGVAWELGGRGGLLLNSNEVQEAEVGISPEGEGVRLEMRTKGAEVEATLVPSPGTVEPRSPGEAEPPGGALEAAICTATVRSKGWGRTFQCPGHLSRWAADPLEGAGRFRHLAIEAAEGSLLLLCSRGAPGAESHGDEEAAGLVARARRRRRRLWGGAPLHPVRRGRAPDPGRPRALAGGRGADDEGGSHKVCWHPAGRH